MQNPPKFTPIGLFGLKVCHLATLAEPAAKLVLPSLRNLQFDVNRNRPISTYLTIYTYVHM
jgi:hypothetical protein